jgi:hypothetical protein
MGDTVVCLIDTIAQVVLPHELPDVFARVQLRGIWRQMQQANISGNAQIAAGLVPAGAVEHHNGMTSGETRRLISARCRFIAPVLA